MTRWHWRSHSHPNFVPIRIFPWTWIFRAAFPWAKPWQISTTTEKAGKSSGGTGCAGEGFYRAFPGEDRGPGPLTETVKGVQGYNFVDKSGSSGSRAQNPNRWRNHARNSHAERDKQILVEHWKRLQYDDMGADAGRHCHQYGNRSDCG